MFVVSSLVALAGLCLDPLGELTRKGEREKTRGEGTGE